MLAFASVQWCAVSAPRADLGCGWAGEICDDGGRCTNGVTCLIGQTTYGGFACADHSACVNQPTGGCDATCSNLNAGWVCPIAGVECVAAMCGDGIAAGTEQCDDGMDCGDTAHTKCTSTSQCLGMAPPSDDLCLPRSGDGCSGTCTLEPGSTCPPGGGSCTAAVCGNNIREGLEQCDLGAANGTGVGCTSLCAIQAGYSCPPPGTSCVALAGRCGDDLLASGRGDH